MGIQRTDELYALLYVLNISFSERYRFAQLSRQQNIFIMALRTDQSVLGMFYLRFSNLNTTTP